MNLNKLKDYIWSYGQLAVSARESKNGEFHRQRMVEPGYWKYLGHDIVKNELSGRWTVAGHPMYFLFGYKTKKRCCEDLWDEYVALLDSATFIEYEIEHEKRENTRRNLLLR